jgi:hypothetical protein
MDCVCVLVWRWFCSKSSNVFVSATRTSVTFVGAKKKTKEKKSMSEEHETPQERTWARMLIEKGRVLDVNTAQVDRLLNDLPNEETRRRAFDTFFTRTGQPWAEPDGNRVFDPSENPLPPLKVLQQRKALNVQLADGPVDGFVLRLWNADDIPGFGSFVREAFRMAAGTSLLFVYPKKHEKGSNSSDEAPPISAFVQEGRRCRFVDVHGDTFDALVLSTSSGLETGQKGRRKTGYIQITSGD